MMNPSSDSDSTRLATGLCPCMAFGISGWRLDGTHAAADLLRMHGLLHGDGHVGAPHRIRLLGGDRAVVGLRAGRGPPVRGQATLLGTPHRGLSPARDYG